MKPEFEYKIKVAFLGPKLAWEIYHSKKDEMGLSI